MGQQCRSARAPGENHGRQRRRRAAGYGLALLSVLGYSTVELATKIGLGELSVYQLAFWRIVFSAAILSPTLLGWQGWRTLPWGRLLAFASLSLIGFTVTHTLSLTLLSPISVATVVGITPVCLLLLGAIPERRRPGALALVASAVGLLGLSFLTFERGGLAFGSALGVLLAVASSVLWSVYPALGGSLAQSVGHNARAFGLMNLVGVPLMVLLTPWFGPVAPPATAAGWLVVLYLALVVSIGLVVFMRAMALAGAEVGVVQYSKPGWTALLATQLFGEVFTPAMGGGMALVFAASLLSYRARPVTAAPAVQFSPRP